MVPTPRPETPDPINTERLIKRLRACAFTAIDPELALWAANTIELSSELINHLAGQVEEYKTKYKRMQETASILDAALREYQQKYGE